MDPLTSTDQPNADLTARQEVELPPGHILRALWTHLSLPPGALSSVRLTGTTHALPSSFHISQLAQETIALSALSAALLHSIRQKSPKIPRICVPLHHASHEFQSEKLYTLSGKPMPSPWTIGGLYPTSDGAVRIHDAFTHHRLAALSLLGLPPDATRSDVAVKTRLWCAIDLETSALAAGAVIYALRTFEQFYQLPAAQALHPMPIDIRKVAPGPPISLPDPSSRPTSQVGNKALRGFRVLELSRVIAAPVAGRTLAVHGADVLWITSPNIPTLPDLDIDLSRGKRSTHLDLSKSEDFSRLRKLASTADVFIQSYRPGSLASKGLSADEVCGWNKDGMVYANLSAWGREGPWSGRRGFDSLVQTAMGFNVAEASAFVDNDENILGRPFPAQALDHASGYLLASGIMAGLYKRAIEGGSYVVDVSLAGTGHFLKSLGQVKDGYREFTEDKIELDVGETIMEDRKTDLGILKAVKHAATIEGLSVDYETLPTHLPGAAEWL